MKDKTPKRERSIEDICRKISDGLSLTSIARQEGISVGNLSEWIEATTERSARARDARILAARTWDDLASMVIEDADTPFELAKAKELAHHYRWRASKIAPRDYGEKVSVGGNPDAPPVAVAQITPDEYRRIAAEIAAKT